MPAAHALVEAKDELAAVRSLDEKTLWSRPGSAATIGFHLKHIPGAIDRLLAYADQRALTAQQMEYLRSEKEVSANPPSAEELYLGVADAIDEALQVLASTDPATLSEARSVGRAALPTTVGGLLFHIAEHTMRHAGQVATTLRALDQPPPRS